MAAYVHFSCSSSSFSSYLSHAILSQTPPFIFLSADNPDRAASSKSPFKIQTLCGFTAAHLLIVRAEWQASSIRLLRATPSRLTEAMPQRPLRLRWVIQHKEESSWQLQLEAPVRVPSALVLYQEGRSLRRLLHLPHSRSLHHLQHHRPRHHRLKYLLHPPRLQQRVRRRQRYLR